MSQPEKYDDPKHSLMPFPEKDRVIYRKNPLTEVLCQLRFPPILKIDSQAPASFQDQIRRKFPLYEERTDIDLPSYFPEEFAKSMKGQMNIKPAYPLHDFISEDRIWKLTLSRDFIALATKQYRTWDEFKEKLLYAIAPLREVYEPSSYTRVGLRYSDEIHRTNLGLTADVPWSDLLQPHISGLLMSEDIRTDIKNMLNQVQIALPDNGARVTIRHGLGLLGPPQEQTYIIDSDFFRNESTEVDNAEAILDYFNRQARYLFRWCITDRLHAAMEPDGTQ